MPEQIESEEPNIPVPDARFSIPVLQQEINDLRAQNGQLRDNRIYLSSLLAEKDEVIGSLLAKLSQETSTPEDAVKED